MQPNIEKFIAKLQYVKRVHKSLPTRSARVAITVIASENFGFPKPEPYLSCGDFRSDAG